jgi:hypothetical protein
MNAYKSKFQESDDKIEKLASLYNGGEEKNKDQILELEKELMNDGVLDKNSKGLPGEFLKKSDFNKFHALTNSRLNDADDQYPPMTPEQEAEYRHWAKKEQELRSKKIEIPSQVKSHSFHSGSEGPKYDPYGYSEIYVTMKNGDEILLHLGLSDYLEVNDEEVVRGDADKAMSEFARLTGLPMEDWEVLEHQRGEAESEDPMGNLSMYEAHFNERTSREDYGDFEDEIEEAKELYSEFKAKMNKALSFDVSKLKMNELEDKKNQLEFIIENLEMLNEHI